MKKRPPQYQILIVGAGISGLVLAERYASRGKRVLVIEKRSHLGGNCYDEFDEAGILISRYGAHLFHTNYEDVWKYLQRFAEWRPYQHRVRAWVDKKLVPVPVNIETVNKIFNLSLSNESEMKQWLEKNQVKNSHPQNSEEMALSRVGPELYEKIFKNYTIKQWKKSPRELEPLVTGRIPVREDFTDNYFTDKYQAQPVAGFTKLFERLIDHPSIDLRLNTNFLNFKKVENLANFEKIFYTGPIDSFFSNQFGKLEYRSLKFQFTTYDKQSYQAFPVINYPNQYKFTRIVEYKQITGQKHEKTTVSREYPTDLGEPYYPVPTQRNRHLATQYKNQAKHLENVYFIGRLAEYRYINMDEAIKGALNLFSRLEK